MNDDLNVIGYGINNFLIKKPNYHNNYKIINSNIVFYDKEKTISQYITTPRNNISSIKNYKSNDNRPKTAREKIIKQDAIIYEERKTSINCEKETQTYIRDYRKYIHPPKKRVSNKGIQTKITLCDMETQTEKQDDE